MVAYALDIALIPLLRYFPSWSLGYGECSGHTSPFLTRCGDLGHHSRPEEVNDGPRVIRRRIRGKTPRHEVLGEVASPPPKRRKWLSIPGPSGGYPGQQPLPSSWSGLEGSRRLDFPEPVPGGYRRSGVQLEQSS